MQRYNDNVINQTGSAVVGASVTVFEQGTSTLAALFADDGVTSKANPVSTNSLGQFWFYAADGRYDLQVTGTNISTLLISDILLEDPDDGSDANFGALTANTLALTTPLPVTSGGTGQSSFTSGQLLIGNASNGLTKATLTAGSGVTITNGDGSITIAAPEVGTVTSVAMTTPTGLSVSGSPITSTGTLAVTLTSGYAIPTTASQTDWDTAYTDRLKWDGGATGLTAATGRTSLELGSIATQNSNSVSITGGAISGITDLAVADGGTGASTSAAALVNLLPSYVGNASKRLTINAGATDVEWVADGGGTVTSVATGTGLTGGPITATGTVSLADTAVVAGAYTYSSITVDAQGRLTAASSGTAPVTSVGMTVPTGLSISGSPITTSGTLALTFTAGYSIPTTASQANWDSAYTQRLQWDGGSTNLVAATGRTSLGGTTVGGNMFTLTNPSAITFPRFNADNTVSALDAATFRTAIGAGTGSGTVTSVTGSAPVASSGGTTPAISLASGYGDTQNPYASKTANYFLAAPNGSAAAPTFRAIVAADIPTLNQNTTGSAASATTATNVAGGAANKIVYNSGAGATAFIDAPTISSTVLNWNGSAFTWVAAGSGTVTSVAVSGGTTGLTTSGGPITGAGTITLAGTLATANGGTGTTVGINGGTF